MDSLIFICQIITWLVALKALIIGSDFSFYDYWLFGKQYKDWYCNRPEFNEKTPECKWKYVNNYSESWWETTCGDAQMFTIGTPTEHKYKFCPYCGRKIAIKEDSGITLSEEVTLSEEIKQYFDRLRFSDTHHLGLGDIRLTLGQQEELVNKVKIMKK